MFLLPKLQKLWDDTRITDSEDQRVMNFAVSMMQHSHQALLISVIAIIILEIFSTRWPNWRDVGVSAIVLLFNAAIFAGITAMCISALLIAPARLPR